MIEESIQRLEYLCETIPPLLRKIAEADFAHVPAPGKWSKKEILGHLIDSAANNHHRFIRAQFEDRPKISYQQNEWNHAGCYNKIDSSQLINLWEAYNRQFVALFRHMDTAKHERLCDSGDPEPRTIAWLFHDYVRHLEHHLKQIISY